MADMLRRLFGGGRAAAQALQTDAQTLQKLHQLEARAESDEHLVELMKSEMRMSEEDARGMLNIVRMSRRLDSR